MNWSIKFSNIKKLSIYFLITFVCANLAYTEVLTGEIRRERQSQEVIKERIEKLNAERKEPEPVYSTAAILFYNAGVQYYQNLNYDKAIDSFQKAVQKEEKFGDAYYNLGILYYHFENPKAALVAFYRAYLSNKKDYEALFYVIKCYVELDDKITAARYLKKIPKDSEFYDKAKEIIK